VRKANPKVNPQDLTSRWSWSFNSSIHQFINSSTRQSGQICRWPALIYITESYILTFPRRMMLDIAKGQAGIEKIGFEFSLNIAVACLETLFIHRLTIHPKTAG